MKSLRIVLGLLVMLLPACSNSAATTMTLQERQQEAESLDPRPVQAVNAFGMKLLRQLTESGDGGNVILSPYSIATALAVAYNGSAGSTADGFAEALGWSGMSLQQVNEGSKLLAKLIAGEGGGVKLQTANSFWYRKGIEMKRSFLRTGRDYYNAKITALNLSGTDAPDTINSWVSKQTEGKIPGIIDKPFGSDTIAIIMNAIYFNGTWTNSFQKNSTQEEDFTLQDGTEKKVPMMRQSEAYPYAESEDWQAIRLPYGDGRFAMTVVLPKPDSSLGELQQTLWADSAPWRDSFATAAVDIRLPRFQAEGDMQLADALKQLGMARAFDPDLADFSNMSDIRPLYIGEVRHKTYVDVNEEGTEAAAVTSVEVKTTAARTSSLTMVVNRPFFFTIEDTQTNIALFAGFVTNP